MARIQKRQHRTKNQLLSAIDDIYIRALKDRHVGYMNQSIRAVLQHLFDNYGSINPLELEDNDTKMRATWDPNSPFNCLVKQIEDGQDYADDGGQPYTAEQLLRIAYTLVFKTGLYFEDCITWNTRPTNQHTWDNFKIHFQTAQRLLRDQMRTTKQAGFHSNFAQHTHPPITQPPAEYQEALINLALSAAADRELLTKLTTSVTAINQHINKLNHQWPLQPAPPLTVKMPDGHYINSTGTTSIDWPDLPPTARTAHVLPQLDPHTLVSIGVLCDHDCIATFDKKSVQIHRHNKQILHSMRLPKGLWSLPLYSPRNKRTPCSQNKHNET